MLDHRRGELFALSMVMDTSYGRSDNALLVQGRVAAKQPGGLLIPQGFGVNTCNSSVSLRLKP